MKKIIYIALLAFLSVLCGCTKQEESPVTGDIGEQIYDIYFRRACYTAFDANRDGFLSADEAAAAERIEIQNVRLPIPSPAGLWQPGGYISCSPLDIAGLQFFPHLKFFGYYTDVFGIKSLDLTANTELKELRIYSEALEKILLPSPCAIERMFLVNGAITEFTIPASVKSLERINCSELKTLAFAEGSSLKTIEEGCFRSCYSLKELVFPEGLEVVEKDAFNGNPTLEKVSLPSTVKTLGTHALANCGKLERLEIHAAVPPAIDRSFEPGSPANKYPIYVPAAALNVYKAAWPEYVWRLKAL